MKSQKHLKFFITQIPLTLQYYHDKQVSSIQYFSLGLLKRLFHASKSLNLTLENILQNPQLDFAAGLTVRAILLDTLISLNFYKLLKDNIKKGLTDLEMEKLTNKFCNTVLADGLRQTANYMELSKKLEFINETQLKDANNKFAKNYADYFEPHNGDGSMPKLKFDKCGAKDFFEKLAGDSAMKPISRIYGLYLHYSKYDHFGLLYFDVEKDLITEKIKRLEKSIRIFIRHYAWLYDILERVSQNDSFIAAQHKIAGDYLISNHGV